MSVRGEFPIFEHATYANSCSQGALSLRVRAAAEEWLAGWDENGAEWEFWVERNEAARAAFAGLLHAAPDEVAVTTSVSQGGQRARLRARPLDGERNRIVISDYEFPTVGQIAHAQALRGAEVVHVRPEPDGSIPPERFAEAVDERTALVCCTAVSFRTGHRHDVAAIAEVAHAQRGARARRQLPGGRRARARRAHARRRRRHRWHRQVPARIGRARRSCGVRGSLARLAAAHADRLVRGRGHLRDVHRRLLAARDGAALRQRHAARAVPLPGRRRDADHCRGRCARDRGARARARRPAARRARRARCDRGDAARSGERGPLVCVVSTDPNALVAACRAQRIVTLAPRDRTFGSRSTSTTSRRRDVDALASRRFLRRIASPARVPHRPESTAAFFADARLVGHGATPRRGRDKRCRWLVHDRAVHAVRDRVRELHLDVVEADRLEPVAVLALGERAGDAADVAPALRRDRRG